MQVECPHCRQALHYAGKRPSFCAYCGQAIGPAKMDSTAGLPAEGPTVAPGPGAEAAEPEPHTLGGYRLVRRLGGGGMGTVYEAEETATGRRVALKVIGGEYAASAEAVERFRREGRLASAIAHPRCVFVLAADEEAGRPYIVMELMPGSTLEDQVAEGGPLPVPEALARILDVIDGLAEAHRLGVIHRDVKPSNCFLEANGRVKVGDFGLSKSLLGEGRLTRTGVFMGTALFASPEQVRGEGVDQQTDVYSVAATLYYLLTGQAPFQGKDMAVTLARIVADPAPPMRGLRPDVPPGLDRVVLRGLERDRQRRWRDLDEFRAALLPFLPGRQAPTGPGVRFGAFLLDYLALTAIGLVIWLVMILAMGRALMNPNYSARHTPLQMVVGVLLWVLYFGVPESIWGSSLGKWLLGLRVRTVAGTDQPGPGRILLRTLVFYLLANLGGFVLVPFLWDRGDLPPGEQLPFALAFYPLEAVGIVLLVCTMRARNGWRGLHDFLTGTCVARVPEVKKRPTVRAGRLDQELARPAGLPERVGAYTVRGALRWEPDEKLLLGEDAALQRQVLLRLRPPSPPTPAGEAGVGEGEVRQARRQLTRPVRLRWLACGRLDGLEWDAFLAPAGRSLPDLVARDGRMPWPEVRPILEQLADELVAAAADGTLPHSPGVNQVWVQPGGQVQLLDWPLTGEEETIERGGDTPPTQQALALLGEVAVLTLEGRPRRAGGREGPGAPVRAPVPEHAARLLARLLGSRKPYQDVEHFNADLAATRDRPTEVTRGRRAAHLAVLTAFLFLGLCGCMLPAGWVRSVFTTFSLQAELDMNQRALRELEEGARRECAVSAVNPDPLVRLRGVAQLDADRKLGERLRQRVERDERERQAQRQAAGWFMREFLHQMDQEMEKQKASGQRPPTSRRTGGNPVRGFRQEARAAVDAPSLTQMGRRALGVTVTIQVLFWPVVWVLWAFLWRGGLTFRMLGVSLARSDGRRAARWQCALRTFLVWAPVTALLLASFWLDVWHWSAGEGADPGAWVPWLSWGLWWGALGLLLVYVLLALLFPRRSLHDWLAGTYLVPQ